MKFVATTAAKYRAVAPDTAVIIVAWRITEMQKIYCISSHSSNGWAIPVRDWPIVGIVTVLPHLKVKALINKFLELKGQNSLHLKVSTLAFAPDGSLIFGSFV